jgi:hypothetical protein
MDQKKPPVAMFVSYSHKDEKHRQRLEIHLSTMRHNGLIADWHDRKIGAGTEWEGQISEHLNRARMILLLVSADFIFSPYCYNKECARAIQRHQAGEARVIPIILKPCLWEEAPFGKLQALPSGGKPVSEWKGQERAFLNIAKGLSVVVSEIQANGATGVPEASQESARRSRLRDARMPLEPHRRPGASSPLVGLTPPGPKASSSTRSNVRSQRIIPKIFDVSDCVGRWKMAWDADDVVMDLRKNGSWKAKASAGIGWGGFISEFQGNWVLHHETNMLEIIQTHYRLAGIWLNHDERWCKDEIQSITKRAITFKDGSKLIRVD